MSYESINLEIVELQQNYTHPDVIGKKIQTTKQLLEDVTSELYRLEASLRKEDLDVEKLENSGLTSIFYKCLGRYEEQMDKEKEEALRARLKYESCKVRQEDLEKTITELTEEQYRMSQTQTKIQRLKEEKRLLIEMGNTEDSEQIQALQEEIHQLKSEIKELKEAITPGKGAARALGNALEVLGSAENWGVFDLLGGDLIADVMKHNKVDEAKRCILTAQNHLQRLQIELKDINMSIESNITVTQGAVLADFFFDGLIADWYMQSKINQSKDNVTRIYRSVTQLVNKLERELSSKESTLRTKEMEIERIIEMA